MTTKTTKKNSAKRLALVPAIVPAPTTAILMTPRQRDRYIAGARAAEARLATIARTRRATDIETAAAEKAYGFAAMATDATMIEILGDLYAGQETPAFNADVVLAGVPVLNLYSTGTGGSAVVQWLTDSCDVREQVTAWLFKEACDLWPSEYGPAPRDILRHVYESALLVVPEHIGAPMTARYHTSAMPVGASVDLRLMLEANLDPDVQRKLRHLDIGDEATIGTLAITRLS